MRDPMEPEERIEVSYSNWEDFGEITLPMHVDIDQQGNQFSFDYPSVQLNPENFKRKE